MNQLHNSGSICANLGICSVSIWRKLFVSYSLTAKPTTANCGGSSFSRERLQSAGISLRLVRSPVAPKITITQGDAAGLSAWFMSQPAFVRVDARKLPRGLFLDVPAELEAHRGKQLGREVSFAARDKALEERFG